MKTLDWEKMNGLLPAIVQDETTREVLMLGYMNEAALAETQRSGYVTFYSRSKKRLWMKGETSGNRLRCCQITADCDGDSLLLLVQAEGPCCHLNTVSCFAETQPSSLHFLAMLPKIIAERARSAMTNSVASPPDTLPKMPRRESYTATLLQSGILKVAQKVGEEGVEVALAAVAQDTIALKNEVADLLYHVLVLLHAREVSLSAVVDVLQERSGIS